MNAEELWTELLAQAATQSRRGQVRRRIQPGAPLDVFLTVDAPDGRRALRVQIPAALGEQIPATRAARGLRIVVSDPYDENGTATVALEVELTDPGSSDIFGVLVDDVAAVTARAGSNAEAVEALLGRLVRWQQLLAGAREGLSEELQRGLWGELWVLRELLAPALGIEAAVRAWQGGPGARDYEHPTGAIEVKTSAANRPQGLRINGERQLDDEGLPGLHLVHLSIDIKRTAGQPLTESVAETIALAANSPAHGELEDKLTDYGYHATHEARYRQPGYSVRDHHIYRVGPGFPRILEADLPVGIGEVSYEISAAACQDFAIDDDTLRRHLSP